MQLNIITSQQQLQFSYIQSNLNQSAKNTDPQLQMPILKDRIEFSDDARRSRDTEHAVERLHKGEHEQNSNPLFNFLKEILEKITGTQVNELKTAPPVSSIPVPSTQNQLPTLAAEQSSLAVETSSLSIGGSITTRDGAKFSFALDLQVMHASASSSSFNLSNSPADGYNFNFAGSAAELTSTSFNFSLTTELPDGTPGTANGLGNFSLKDDLKEVRQTLKPFLEAFLKDSGMPSDKKSVKQLLHAIV